MTSTSGGAGCSQNLWKALLRGLFVNVVEQAGEGKYRTVSDMWVKGREGGRNGLVYHMLYREP